MRVLHLIKTSVGASWAVRQVRELVQLGVEVHVALPVGGPMTARYREVGAVVHDEQFDLPVARPWLWPRRFARLRRLIDATRPQLIHSHFVGTTLTMRLALGRRHPVPRLFQVPGPLHLEHALFGSAETASAGPSDYWIGSCRLTCDLYARRGVHRDRIFLSYYGLDLDALCGHAPGKLRDELDVGPDRPLIGMVAYMYAPKWFLGQTRGLKGHEDLIDAIAICRRSRPEILGVIVGGAWQGAVSYEARVRRYARERCGNAVVFLGTRGDVAELYADFDVVAHPSHSENVGGAAESLSLAVPTIATRVGGFPDLIEHGRTGWLVEPRAPRELARVILDVLADGEAARRVGRAGQARAHELFDVRRTAGEVFEIYRRVLASAS